MKGTSWKTVHLVLRICLLVVVLVQFFLSISISQLTTEQQGGSKYILIRSIGNSLPPRHSRTQSYANLKFVLQHEPPFHRVHKHWILNRIVDEDIIQQLVTLLDQYQQSYSILPFNLTQYSAIPYSYHRDYHGVKDIIHSELYHRHLTTSQRLEIQDDISHEKNIYVTNNNNARNEMLAIGKAHGAGWILPWDGNCFLTVAAFQQIDQAVDKFGDKSKYFITPMDRLQGQDNDVLLTKDFSPHATEEPQVIFHRTSKAQFDPRFRYGRRNKVEILLRLGVPGEWDKWSWNSWEKHLNPSRKHVQDGPDKVPSAGWVARLASGNKDVEKDDMLSQRGHVRSQSIERILNRLDVRVAREIYHWSSDSLLFYDLEQLKTETRQASQGHLKLQRIRKELLITAEKALVSGPWSVMDKTKDPPSKNRHDYYHPAPYYWPQMFPNGTVDENAPYILKDGLRVPGTELYDENSDRYDRTRLLAMKYNTTILALAYAMTNETKFAAKAASNIRTWFLDPVSLMTPHLNYAQVRWGHDAKNRGSPRGLIEMKDVYFFLDAVRIVRQSGQLSGKEYSSLQEWFYGYLIWLETSEQGRRESRAENNHGLYYDIQVLSIAAFVNDTSRFVHYAHRSVSRLSGHVSSDGRLSHELKRATCEHYQLFTLQGWITLDRIVSKIGLDIWKLDNSALCRACVYAIPYFRNRTECDGNIKAVDMRRWWPLWWNARQHCSSHSQNPDLPDDKYDMPTLYFQHDGIAPFWNLGSPEIPNGY